MSLQAQREFSDYMNGGSGIVNKTQRRKRRKNKDFQPSDARYWKMRGKTNKEALDFWECPSGWSREYQSGAEQAYREGRAEAEQERNRREAE